MGDLVALTKDKFSRQLSGFGIKKYSLVDYVDPDDGVTKFLLQVNCDTLHEMKLVHDFLSATQDSDTQVDVIATFKASDV